MISYKDKIRNIARKNNGVVSVRLADKNGVSAGLLRQYAIRNKNFVNTAKGIYILYDNDIDTEFAKYSYFIELAGENSFLLGGSVLAMLNLGYIEPNIFYVANKQYKTKKYLKDKALVKVPYTYKFGKITTYNNVKSQNVYDAIKTYTNYIMPERLLDAVDQAESQGLITKKETSSLYKIIKNNKLVKV
jgi:hypothetical protein